MSRQLVLYLDNCVFSNLLKTDNLGLRKSFGSLPHRIAFSDVHVREMRDNHEEYSALLKELDAVFVRNPGQVHGRHDRISSLDPAIPEERFAAHFEFLSAFNAFDSMLKPMHHLLGGRRDKSIDQIARETEGEISEALEELLAHEPEGHFAPNLSPLREATEYLTSIEAAKGWEAIDDQVSASRDGDPMREMNPFEKVLHVLSKLDEAERHKFMELYPERFAQLRVLKVGDLAGFAFALFSMGLTKRKGIFSGKHQTQNFAAQFRDAQHIEEASRCDWFVTSDLGASELAASTLGYAGFPTRTILLRLEK